MFELINTELSDLLLILLHKLQVFKEAMNHTHSQKMLQSV